MSSRFDDDRFDFGRPEAARPDVERLAVDRFAPDDERFDVDEERLLAVAITKSPSAAA
jgi:hypothetical protein